MTDSSKFHSNWKTPFVFAHHDNQSLDDLKLLAPSKLNSTSPPLPRLTPSSPYQTQTHRHSLFQPFDPFNTDILETTTTTTKDADLDELSNLLSRQLLDHVDAEPLPTTSNSNKDNNRSPTTSSPSIQNYSLPATSWCLDGGASDRIKKPWSPALHTSGLLASSSSSSQTTLLSQQNDDDGHGNSNTVDNNNGGNNSTIGRVTNNNDILLSSSSPPPPPVAAATSTWWDRYGPYGNDSEFDPTLPFYQGDRDHTATAMDVPGTINQDDKKVAEDQASNKDTEQQQAIDMTVMALKKLCTLFPDLDEKELGQTLAALDYDVERTIETLLPQLPSFATTTTITGITSTSSPARPTLAATSLSTAPTTATAEKVHLIKPPVNLTTSPPLSPHSAVAIGSPKKHQVCRHYLAGQCYRKDCWFAHDLEVKLCKFWLQGSCLKGDTCEFAHSLEEIDQVAKYHHQQQQVANNKNSNSHQLDLRQQYQSYHHHQQEQQPYTPTTVADFPILVARSNRKSKKSHNKKSFKK